jgi:outer membrane protein assembly factor BamB
MSTTEPEAPTPRRSLFRIGFPCLLVVMAIGVPAVLWSMPDEKLERGPRVFATEGAWILVAIGFLLWLVIYYRRVGLLALLLGGILVAGMYTRIIDVKNDGDLMPTSVHLKFLSTPASDLVSHRAAHPFTSAEAKPDLLIATAEDMPAYRGVKRDGVATGPALERDWTKHPPRQLWRHPVGAGYAAFAVAGGVAVTIEQREGDEAVVCYNADTGSERWVYSYPADFTEPLGGPGPRATPTIYEGDVYSLGAKGRLACIDGATGKEKWHVEILDGNGNIMWAMSGSPLVFGDVVVVNPGVQKDSESLRALVAYDRKTGARVWGAGNTRAGYASPMLATLAGVEQILLFDGVEIAGYAAKDGAKLWNLPWKTHQDINVAQPLVFDGDRVFVSSGYGVGCAMLHITKSGDAWSVKELWRNMLLRLKMSSPVAFQGHIYGQDDGFLVCLDADTGARKWKGKRYGHDQILLSGDLIVVLAENGKLALVEATPQAFREVASIQAIEGRTWNYSALARGRVYVRNDIEMAAYELKMHMEKVK